jgi:hypothetical protein
LNLFVRARLLCAELIAGKAKDCEALRFVLPVKGFKACVLFCETALTCHIHYKYDLVFVLSQVVGFVLVILDFEAVEGLGHLGAPGGGGEAGVLEITQTGNSI